MNGSSRRRFLGTALGAPLAAAGCAAVGTRSDGPGFFSLDRRNDRWFLIAPDGRPFFSLGLNHIDSASLRYPENGGIWNEKYGGDPLRWLRESVGPRLRDWGFNTVGWVQEVVTRGPSNHRHSRNFTRMEYDAIGLPYGHMLPFADFHQWEAETRHPEFFSREFEDWCDHVAREHCAVLADDRKLIGYFYLDCPTWVHTRPMNAWKGPIFDPGLLKTEAGKRRLKEVAGRYYKVTHDAVRRYDPNHLILGDRYEANAPLPLEVVEAARPYVDVLSFQDFKAPGAQLAEWHRRTGMPVLWADGAKGRRLPDGNRRNDGTWYAAEVARLRESPGCVGAHLCGAFVRNRVRRRGLLDERERPDTEMIDAIRKANREAERWAARFG